MYLWGNLHHLPTTSPLSLHSPPFRPPLPPLMSSTGRPRDGCPANGRIFLLTQTMHARLAPPRPAAPSPHTLKYLWQVAQRVSQLLGHHDDPTTRELCLDVLAAVAHGAGGLPRRILVDVGRSLRSPFLPVRNLRLTLSSTL